MKGKKLLVMIGVICLALIIAVMPFVGCAKEAPAPTPTPTPTPAPAPEVIELRLSFEWAETGLSYQEGYKPWIEEVEERTDGKVKITPYFSSSLNPLPEAYPACKSGVADIVELNYTVVPGMFPMQELLSQILPSTPWSKWSRIHWELFTKFREDYEAEMTGVQPLFIQSFGPGTLAMINKPIHTLEDVEGTKIMGIGKPSVDQLSALGFIVVEKYPPEFYSTMEKGVVDGAGLSRQAVFYEWGIAPLIKYVIDIHHANVNFFAVMNMDKWNSLPADVQQVFEELGGEYAADLFDNAYYASTRVDGEEYMSTKYGTEFITLTPEELARWDEVVKPVHEAALDDVEAQGYPAWEVYEEYYRLVEEYKW